ncbi:MAG TPA: LuxR C-terminal-related transcriptional regulator [Acidimicrobiia bacterium]|nr:LuxR C-terminal-related transcriptional regulator [Acidimicrobiia bacterium]
MASGERGVFGAMSAPLAPSTMHNASKFAMPIPPPSFARRPRVEKRLDAAATVRLTILTGCAGSGKTALAASWMAQRPECDRSWLTLDDDDNAPATFWSDIDGAVQRLDGDRFGRFLGVRPPRDGFLVVDESDVLTTVAARRSLVQLVELAPPWMHLIIVGREQPALALWRLRAAGDLVEIDDGDLRLDLFEATEVVSRHKNISPAETAALHERSEGWMTGLKLLASGSASPADSDGDAEEQIREFLLEEVFNRQSADVQDFLMETSCIARLTPAICEHVTGRSDAADVLHDLHRANAFVSRLPGQYGLYRCHPQYRAVLRDEMVARDPDRVVEIHISAARWYRDHGDPAAAVEQWIAARNVPGAMHPIPDDDFVSVCVVDPDEAQRSDVHLSPRELEVLSYLSTELPAREIAQSLYVSRNTLKTHMHNVYRKLGCASRGAAVERARELRLLH